MDVNNQTAAWPPKHSATTSKGDDETIAVFNDNTSMRDDDELATTATSSPYASEENGASPAKRQRSMADLLKAFSASEQRRKQARWATFVDSEALGIGEANGGGPLKRSVCMDDVGKPLPWVVEAMLIPTVSRHAMMTTKQADFTRVAAPAQTLFSGGAKSTSSASLAFGSSHHRDRSGGLSARSGDLSWKSSTMESGSGTAGGWPSSAGSSCFGSKVPHGSRSSLADGAAGSNALNVLDEVVGKMKMRPILVVPSSAGSCIVNRQNVCDFLQNGNFVAAGAAPATPRSGDSSASSGGSTDIVRDINGKRIKFRVMESSEVLKLSPREWHAVVAVVVAGPEWQFARWPFRDMFSIFRTIKGFHFVYHDSPLPQHVDLWGNCEILRIHRVHKHYHASLVNEFWRSLSEFLSKPRKSFLDPSAQLSVGSSPITPTHQRQTAHTPVSR